MSYQLQGSSLQWHHNGHDSISDHQPHDCLLNRLFRHRSKKTSKLRITGLCVGNFTGDRWNPVNSPHKWPVTWKMFPFADVIMSTTDMVWVQGISVLEFLFWNFLTILNRIFHDKSFMIDKKLKLPSSWSSDHILLSCNSFVCHISLVRICVQRDLMLLWRHVICVRVFPIPGKIGFLYSLDDI